MTFKVTAGGLPSHLASAEHAALVLRQPFQIQDLAAPRLQLGKHLRTIQTARFDITARARDRKKGAEARSAGDDGRRGTSRNKRGKEMDKPWKRGARRRRERCTQAPPCVYAREGEYVCVCVCGWWVCACVQRK